MIHLSQSILKRRFGLVVAAVLLLAILLDPAGSQAAANKNPDLTPADEALLAVRDSVRAGKLDLARTQAAQMARLDPDHPLLSYAEYWPLSAALKMRPAGADDDSVRAFIARNEGSVVADLARRDWLLVLGKRGDFQTFDAELPKFVLNDDAQVGCYALLSKYQSRKRPSAPDADGSSDALLTSIRNTLAVARTIDGEACAALGDAVSNDGRLKPEEIWTWIRWASDANLSNAIRRYVSFLPDTPSMNAGPAPAVLTVVLDKPVLWLAKNNGPQTNTARELVLLALSRTARSEPEQTVTLLERSWANRLRPEDLAYVWAEIGAAAAKKQLLEAAEWSRKSLSATNLSEDVLGWQVRAALRTEDWPLVRTLIEKMPPEMRRGNDGAWVYWLGRALKFEGRNEEAKAQWLSLVGQFNFYGQLASEELGLTLTVPARALPISEPEVATVKDLPGFTRALRFYQIDMRASGNLEWNFTLRNMSDRQLLASAEWAQRNSVLDRAVNSADRTRSEHDFSVRFLAPFKTAMQTKVDQAGLDIAWVYGLIRQESRFVAVARSTVGAAGLMQVMPSTARYVAKKIGMSDYRPDAIHDLDTNLTLGTQYLRMVLDDLDDLPVLATAAYNAGPGRSRTWRSTLLRPVEGAIFAETIPFNETRDYVKKVMSNAVYYGLLDGKLQSLKARMGMIVPKGYIESTLP